MSDRVSLALTLAALLLAAGAPVFAPSAGAQGPGVVPSDISLDNPEVVPDVLQPGQRVEVELVVRYFYTTAAAGAGRTTAHISAPDRPDWLNVQFRPAEWTMFLEPTRQSVTERVVLLLDADVDAPAVLPSQLTLHLVAEENGAIARAENDYKPFVEAAFVPRLSVDLSEHPVVVPKEAVKATNFRVTNLGNAPVIPQFRLVETPSDVQAGISNEGRVLGSEAEHQEHSVNSEVTVLIKDLGGEWEQGRLTIDVEYRPTRRPDHPAALQTIRLQLVRPIGAVNAEVVGTFALAGAVVVGGAWFLHRRREVYWPGDD